MGTYTSPMGIAPLQIMVYHPIKEIWFYLLAAAVLAALAGYAWQYRRMPAAPYWVLSLSLRAVFLMALVMVTVSPALADKVFWVKIQQTCAVAILPTILLFVATIAEKKGRVIRAFMQALVALTVFGILALLTTGWHGWFWRGVAWDGVTFGVIRGPIYWTIMGVAYFYILVVSTLCFIWARRASGLRRWQILVLPVDPLISVIGHILWAIDQKADIIPPLPLAFMLSGIAYSWIFFRLRVFNLAQLAQTAVTRNMNDSLIIVDDQDYIVEFNPAARKLLGERIPGLVGSRSATAFAPWPALAELAVGCEARTGEISLEGGHYLFRVMPLAGWKNSSIGKAIVLQDIAELKQAQAQIAEQQKALSITAERDRLRRELHDGSGQIWGYLKLQYQQLRDLLAGQRLDEVDGRLQKLMTLSDDFHRGVRDSLAGLKTATGKGLVPTLGEYMQWYENTYGINTRLTAVPEMTAQLLPSVELQLLRIIQEAMANTRKHARASLVQVTFRMDGGQAAVVIEDDGYGFDAAAAFAAGENRHGLRIMQERALEIGGRLEIESGPGAGTRVTVWLPPEQRRVWA